MKPFSRALPAALLAALLAALALILLLGAPLTAVAETTPQGGTHMDLTYDLRLSEEGTAYYISSSLGSDENDGLSEATPWKSFAHIEAMNLKPGDRVLLRRGDIWHERLTIRGSGRKDAWIFVGSYGDTADPKPEISLQNKRDDIALLATDISVGGQNGFGLNYIPVRDLDPRLDYYTPVIITNEAMIAGHPDTVRAFLAATCRGYMDAIADPAGCAAILNKYAPDYAPEFLTLSQEYLAGKYMEDADRWGEMKQSVWDDYTDFMVEYGLLDAPIDAGELYTNAFLPEAE